MRQWKRINQSHCPSINRLTGRTPTVLNEKVRFLRIEISSVSDSENTVIDGSAAATIVVVDDSILVKLKDKLTRLDGNANGLHGNSRNQGLYVTRWHVDKSLDNGSGNVRAVGHALRVALRKVRVVLFRAKSTGFFIKFKSVLQERIIADECELRTVATTIRFRAAR